MTATRTLHPNPRMDFAKRRLRYGVASVLLGAVAVLLGNALYAAGLFLPAGPGGADDAARAATAGVRGRGASGAAYSWERHVRVARHQLAAVRAAIESAGAGRLLLNLADGVRLHVTVERTAPTKFGYSLSGRVVGGVARVGFVTLVVHEEAVAGSFWTPDSAYELAYLGGGVHALRDVTNKQHVECAGALPSGLSALDTNIQANPDDTDEDSIVDILVVWTPAAEGQEGGEQQMLSRVELEIAYANDAFERSGALVSLNLVGAERVDYSEVDMFTDIDRLADPDDGHMDAVHDRRDALGADLVHLRAGLPSDRAGGIVVGIAQFHGAFSINALAHEIGHNFGIRHDRGDSLRVGGTYNFGFTTGGCQPTIMSYNTRCPSGSNPIRPHYASPWRYGPGNGRALGVSRFSQERGLDGPADAVLTLNRNRHRIANLRPSRNGG